MVGFISKHNPKKINAWSGTHYFIYKSIEEHVAPAKPLCVNTPARLPFYKYSAKVKRVLTGRNYKHEYNPSLARAYAKLFDREVERYKDKLDFLFSSLTLPEIGLMQTEVPIVATADATFPLLKDYYPGHSNLPKTIEKSAYELEKAGLEKAKYIIYPLEWAANSAIQEYGIPREKVFVQPYGANLEMPPSGRQVKHLIKERSIASTINLLFIGGDWRRKGGRKAYAVKNFLHNKGWKTHLFVCGCTPPDECKDNQVSVFPFLDKSKQEDRRKLSKLYSKSHFFLLPTKNECVGMVLNEAAAFGLPVLSTDTGGVSTAVKDGKTGYLFEVESDPKEYGEKIIELTDSPMYKKISFQARQRYEKLLNWDQWGLRMKKIYKLINNI